MLEALERGDLEAWLNDAQDGETADPSRFAGIVSIP
jgi:hypothetical protein